VDQRLDRLRVETKTLLRYVGNKFSTRLPICIQKLAARSVSTEVGFVFRSQERGFVMIEPPGELLGSCVLEVDDRVLVRIKHSQVKQISRPVQQACVINFRFRMDALFVETSEGRCGSDPVETVSVIKEA
jgi:hypothetical protein